MARVHIYHSYKLKEGKSEQDFLRVAEKFSNDSSLKTKGFVSWTLLRDGEMWADILVYETMEDFKNAIGSVHKNPLVRELGSFFDISSITEHRFSVEEST
jgi:quinol monooxygenase YgiN